MQRQSRKPNSHPSFVPRLSILESEQHQENGQNKSYESQDGKSPLGFTLNKTKESENQTVTIGGHRFLM